MYAKQETVTQVEHQYAVHAGEQVQVLTRFRAYPDCRNCGGQELTQDGERCPACDGKGRSPHRYSYAEIGYLTGENAGRIAEVPVAALSNVRELSNAEARKLTEVSA